MAVRFRIHRVDITYLIGVTVAGFTIIKHDYNTGAFVFAAACLGLPALWKVTGKSNGDTNGSDRS